MPKPAPPALPERTAVIEMMHEFVGAIIAGTDEEYREPTFRCSAFPYCPLLQASTLPWKQSAYRSDFYFKVGTAIHTLIQQWASRTVYTVELWGNWRCSCCEARVERVGELRYQHCTKPNFLCERCEAAGEPAYEWLYEEVELLWHGLSGHVDTILKIGPYYVVVDYKTTEFRAGGSVADRKRYPYVANVVQIEIYCTLLRELLGLDIIYWNLVYVNRGRPMRSIADYHSVLGPEWTSEHHARTLKILEWAARIDPVAAAARHAFTAGEPVPQATIEQLVDGRPCKTTSRWRAWMAARFYWERDQFNLDAPGECPHLAACTSPDPATVDQYWLELFGQNS